MKISKFLFAIAFGVVILVAALLISAVLYFNARLYRAEDTPEGVAHNYLLALQRKDYERAYTYLSPTLGGYPAGVEQFAADVERLAADPERPPYDINWYHVEVSLAIESVQIYDDAASVLVRRTELTRRAPFDNEQSSYTFYMHLQREHGAWKISWAERYWSDCWDYRESPGCR